MTIRSRRRSFAPSSIGRSFRSGSAHSNTRAPSATTSWLGTMMPTTTAASAISRRADVHYGRAPAILDLRHRTRLVAYAAHPERFVSGPPRPETLPTAVWINPPSRTTRQDASGPTTGTPDDSAGMRSLPGRDRRSTGRRFHRVDGVESLQYMLNQVVSKTLTRPASSDASRLPRSEVGNNETVLGS